MSNKTLNISDHIVPSLNRVKQRAIHVMRGGSISILT